MNAAKFYEETFHEENRLNFFRDIPEKELSRVQKIILSSLKYRFESYKNWKFLQHLTTELKIKNDLKFSI